jgi:DNA gyrase subunit A
VGEISIVGRNTQGVRLIRLGEGERLTGVERIDSLGEDAAGPETPPADLAGGETEPDAPSGTPTS